MSHKKKICNLALATKVEQCFEGHSFVPLKVNRHSKLLADNEAVGLTAVVKEDLRELKAKHETQKKHSHAEESPSLVASKLISTLQEGACCGQSMGETNISSIKSSIVDSISQTRAKRDKEEELEIIAKAGPLVDLSNPYRALRARMSQQAELTDVKELSKRPFVMKDIYQLEELSQLGIFFNEATCFECQGITYKPCGVESTLLPHETFTRSTTEGTTLTTNQSESESATTDISTTDKATSESTLVQSYDQTVRDTLNVKKSIKGSVSGKLFKILDASLSSDTSVDFTHFIERVNKSSLTENNTLLNEVVQTFNLTQDRSRSETYTVSTSSQTDQSLTNPSDEPLHFIEREGHCVYTVTLKRTNAFLGWSGCIENPGEDLCTPDNIEEKHSAEIQAIRDKWNVASPPSSFGSRPANKRIRSSAGEEDAWGSTFADKVVFNIDVQGSIPAGHGYIPGSAQVIIIDSDTPVSSSQITSEPASGASGFVTFGMRIEVENKFANREDVTAVVEYDVSTPAAAEYDQRVTNWKTEEAEKEVAKLLAKVTEELNEFLLSDRVRATLERKIIEKYFGSSGTEGCCELIKHLHRIFDFNSLCYKNLPSWNATETGCQSTNPVNFLTAKCTSFYVPIRTGMEFDAMDILRAINVLPNSSSLTNQIAGYINSIREMRENFFERSFDPVELQKKLEGPSGGILTPYDTSSDEWNFEFETNPHQLIDASVVTVPCGGSRKELRGNLCQG